MRPRKSPGPRPPRDLVNYIPAELAARDLEELAQRVRRGGGLVKFNLQLRFWEAPPVKAIDVRTAGEEQ